MNTFKLISSEALDLTPEFAADFAAMKPSPTERELKPKRVQHLKDVVLSGSALSFHWAKAYIVSTGETVRVNGQHSSLMLSKLDGAFPEGLRVHLDTYEVMDVHGLTDLFGHFDNRSSARTVDDIAGAYQGVEPDLLNVPRRAGRVAVEGAGWFLKTIRGDYIPNGDERFSLFAKPELHPFIQVTGRIYSAKTPEFTTPVVGAMYGSFEIDPAICEEFWADVAVQGGGNEPNHPATSLDAWLVDAKTNPEKKISEREVYRACALAWNAYRNHRTLDRIGKYDPKKGAPELD
jgi:hypothetical protein